MGRTRFRHIVLALGIVGSVAVTGCSSDSTSSASTASLPASIPGLPSAALKVMNKPAYAKGSWALLVRDLTSGQTLISYNANKLVEPASVTKTYSMGAGWLFFGPHSRVVTPVKQMGTRSGDTLDGSLVLVGKGDLTMGGRTKLDGTLDFANLDHNDANALPGATLTTEDPLAGLNRLAAQVRAAGISHVQGDVIIDDRLFSTTLEGQPISPIIINNNLIDFTTTPATEGQTATVVMRPQVAPWTVTSEVQTVAPGEATKIAVTSPTPGHVVLSGSIAAGAPPAVNVYAFDDPATYARTAFIEALERAGVTVSANPTTTNSTASLPSQAAVNALPSVAHLDSLPLWEETKYVLKVSYNRGAETMICRLAVAAGSTDCDTGLTKAGDIWRNAGMDTRGVSLIDGSGLSNNVVTASSQVQLQAIMSKRPDASLWKSTLPIIGVDGSLALVKTSPGCKGKVFAKTGSLAIPDYFNNRIRIPSKALGGYIDAASGRHLAFAIVASNATYRSVSGVFAANNDVGEVACAIQQAY